MKLSRKPADCNEGWLMVSPAWRYLNRVHILLSFILGVFLGIAIQWLLFKFTE